MKKIIKSSKELQLVDFNKLCIPDRSIVNYKEYFRQTGHSMFKDTVSIQATRGCPYRCAYCHEISQKTHRIRSFENVFEEIKSLYDIGLRRFSFIDDVFNLNKKNSEAFFRKIIDNGLDIQMYFPSGMRGDILTEEYIDLAVKAGMIAMSLSLETATPRLQKLVMKNLKIDRLRENIEYLTMKYPHVILNLQTMVGFPTETKEEVLNTIEFVKNIKWIHFPYVHILKIYPNTKMMEIALEQGISHESIYNSIDKGLHEVPETLPFDASFVKEIQSTLLFDYFLSKERLLTLLPHQFNVFSEEEIVQNYDSYLPYEVKTLDDLLRLTGISRDEIKFDKIIEEKSKFVPNINQKLKSISKSPKKVNKNAFRLLLLDLSIYFSKDRTLLYDVNEAPLGLMYLLSHFHETFKEKINGKIAKSRVDFDSFEELNQLIKDFKPDLIGIRTLSYHKEFFHQTIEIIKKSYKDIPIVAGGPYASSDYEALLQDDNVDLAIIGEGEIPLGELIEKMIKNNNNLPENEILESISGVAYAGDELVEEKSAPLKEVVFDNTDFDF